MKQAMIQCPCGYAWTAGTARCRECGSSLPADLIETLTAPVEGMETTAEERAAFKDRCDRIAELFGPTDTWEGLASRLLRDFDRLHAQLAAERARAETAVAKLPELNRKIERLEISTKNQVKITDQWRARAERMAEALREVEEWWLSEGMKHFNGAPYAMFAVRAALTEKPS